VKYTFEEKEGITQCIVQIDLTVRKRRIKRYIPEKDKTIDTKLGWGLCDQIK
jgi:hypothetical protein